MPTLWRYYLLLLPIVCEGYASAKVFVNICFTASRNTGRCWGPFWKHVKNIYFLYL